VRYAFAPRLCRLCRDRLLERITLGYHQSATSACIGDVSTGCCAKNRPRPRRAGRVPHGSSRSFSSRGAAPADAFDPRVNASASMPDAPRREGAMRLISATSQRVTGRTAASAHLPFSKRPAAANAFWVLGPDRRRPKSTHFLPRAGEGPGVIVVGLHAGIDWSVVTAPKGPPVLDPNRSRRPRECTVLPWRASS